VRQSSTSAKIAGGVAGIILDDTLLDALLVMPSIGSGSHGLRSFFLASHRMTTAGWGGVLIPLPAQGKYDVSVTRSTIILTRDGAAGGVTAVGFSGRSSSGECALHLYKQRSSDGGRRSIWDASLRLGVPRGS
jgi:hypothetical protein